MRIAVDAMGGDHAPRVNVDGAIAAAREFGITSLLVGKPAALGPMLAGAGEAGRQIEIVEATEVVEMEDPATAAIRKKRNSSIRIAANCVRDGRAAGLVSAGHTGAAMVSAKMVIGTIEGVDRPALATVLPNLSGHCLLLDVGANPEAKTSHFKEFAIMGSIYAQLAFGKPNPSIGLMSIGEEDSKGTDRTKEAFKGLKEAGLNFIGNVEGRDVFSGKVDVIVTDGFTGNVILKVSESLSEMVEQLLREEIKKTLQASVGFLLSRSAFRSFKTRLDYSEYGGAPLLGVKGCVIICHGRSSAKAVKNAIRLAAEFSRQNLATKIQSSIAELHSRDAQAQA
ncbi:MAG: phosphate acyltransferase PlsX [Acidobacteria bacterium]|nr:phosphate acyltransferase PlsX [Acidobacteriota bacterium]MCA1610113.1 phosphate acyltransferase PlsX [Acidobacteriota bacterium]